MSDSISAQDVEQARHLLEEVRDEWLSRPYVTGLDIGFHYENGVRCEQLAIRVHMRRARPESVALEFPDHLGQFPVDLIEAEYEPEH
jgi:hypothetical protein